MELLTLGTGDRVYMLQLFNYNLTLIIIRPQQTMKVKSATAGVASAVCPPRDDSRTH